MPRGIGTRGPEAHAWITEWCSSTLFACYRFDLKDDVSYGTSPISCEGANSTGFKAHDNPL